MRKGRDRSQYPGIAYKSVQFLPAFVDRCTKPVERGIILHVAWDERRLAAERTDLVIELFEGALCAGERDHMSPRAGKFDCHRTSDAARCAGHESDAADKIARNFRRRRHMSLQIHLAGALR